MIKCITLHSKLVTVLADVVDAGLYNLYIDAGTTKFSGLFRDASDSGKWNWFEELERLVSKK